MIDVLDGFPIDRRVLVLAVPYARRCWSVVATAEVGGVTFRAAECGVGLESMRKRTAASVSMALAQHERGAP